MSVSSSDGCDSLFGWRLATGLVGCMYFIPAYLHWRVGRDRVCMDDHHRILYGTFFVVIGIYAILRESLGWLVFRVAFGGALGLFLTFIMMHQIAAISDSLGSTIWHTLITALCGIVMLSGGVMVIAALSINHASPMFLNPRLWFALVSGTGILVACYIELNHQNRSLPPNIIAPPTFGASRCILISRAILFLTIAITIFTQGADCAGSNLLLFHIFAAAGLYKLSAIVCIHLDNISVSQSPIVVPV